MNFAARRPIYTKLERARKSKVITYVTSDRKNVETQIAQDCIDIFVELLDEIGPTKKISLVLHTNGGQTSAAWRLVNLIRTFCDELEVIVPLKAMSAGTLISLGAQTIMMTKQAALGPIDPSVNHALGPQVPNGNQLARVPVSVEAIRGYLDAAQQDLKITDANTLGAILMDLSNKVHPLVLGEIFRSRAQIRFLAEKLLSDQVKDPDKVKEIIDFLCADSGSHDYTINRREAAALGLSIEKPTDEIYEIVKSVHHSYREQMQLLSPYSSTVELGAAQTKRYQLVRGLIESRHGGCYAFVSEGTLTKTQVPNNASPTGTSDAITDQRTFEGWKKL